MSKSDVKAVIFDLDGVICSTDVYHEKAWACLCASYGIPFSHEVNNLLRGIGRRESLDIILAQAGMSFPEDVKDKMLQYKNSLYRSFLEEMTEKSVSEDVLSTLRSLKKRYPLAIGSSSRNTRLILSRIGLSDFFDAVCDGTCIRRSKPDSEVFLKAAALLGIPPTSCLVVEDAKSGIDAAFSGHFISAGIGDAALSDKADFRIRRLSDLLNIL